MPWPTVNRNHLGTDNLSMTSRSPRATGPGQGMGKKAKNVRRVMPRRVNVVVLFERESICDGTTINIQWGGA